MKKLYLAGIIVVFLFILIAVLPQVGATCSWYPPLKGVKIPALALFQVAGLGAILGGLSILFWNATKESKQWDKEEEGVDTPEDKSAPEGKSKD